MSELARRTLDELAARYFLEPELKDVFVEGDYDCDLIVASLEEEQKEARSVYSIDTVEVPGVVLRQFGLTSGNRQRVIALAKTLEVELEGSFSYLCLVDRDLDHWFGELEIVRNLRWTAYTSLEVGLFEKSQLRRLLCEICKAQITDFDVFFKSFCDILVDLYVLRLADHEIGSCLSWIDLKKYVSRDQNELRFDSDVYLKRVLAKNSRGQMCDLFIQAIDRWRNHLSGDIRQFVRGHDFIALTSLAVKEFNGIGEVGSQKALYRLLVMLAKDNTTISSEICIQPVAD